MKLITAIVNKDDSSAVQRALTSQSFQLTRTASTGGFLQAGNVTFMMAVEDDKVDEAIEIIRTNSCKRKSLVPTSAVYGMMVDISTPIEVTVGGATVIVQDIVRFEKL